MNLFFNQNDNQKSIDLIVQYNELQSNYDILKREYTKLHKEYEELEQNVANLKKQERQLNKSVDPNSLEYIDELSYLEFKEYIQKLLIKLGYLNVKKTDDNQGIDILTEKDNITYAIQCKICRDKLGNNCIKEAHTGRKYYQKNVAIVISNVLFTKEAIDTAKEVGVVLWDRDVLENMLNKISSTTAPVSKEEQPKIEKQSNQDEVDSLYNDVVTFAISNGKLSTSLIQRKFRIGYNRAARIIEQLESKGIIGPQNGSSPREVLVNK